MKITYELDLENFHAWSGAVSTLERIRNAGLCKTLEDVLEDCFPDGMNETELNDLLWFDPEWCFHACGLRTEDDVSYDIGKCKDDLDDLMVEYESECATIEDALRENGKYTEAAFAFEKEKLWRDEYKEKYDEINEEIEALREELEEF